MCCNGYVTSRVGGSKAKCCGYLSYDETSYFCLKSKVYPLCQRKSYNPSVAVCCLGTQQPRIGGLASKCCANVSYDSRINFCYNKVVYGRCRQQEYNPGTHQCCSEYLVERAGSNSRCCGQKSYHPDKFFCSHNKLYALCAHSSYNPLGDLCCAGSSIPLGKVPLRYASCCAKSVYNTQAYFCFQDVVYLKCGSQAYDPRSQSCCNGKVLHLVGGQYSRCCGSVNYDSKDYFCYNNKTVIHKCNNRIYNPAR